MIEPVISRVRRASGITPKGNDVVAMFDVDVSPFKLHSCSIARSSETGRYYVALPRRRDTKFSITDDDLKMRIKAEALRKHEEFLNDGG